MAAITADSCSHLGGTCPCPRVPPSLFCRHHACPSCQKDKSSKAERCRSCRDVIDDAASPTAAERRRKRRQFMKRLGETGRGAEQDQLRILLDNHVITPDEFDRRLLRLKSRATDSFTRPFNTPKETTDIECDIDPSASEVVFKYSYDFCNRKWQKSLLLVDIEQESFAKGGFRFAYRMKDLTKVPGENAYVAKASKVPEDSEVYFVDVEMQALCQFIGKQYNRCGPPKPVEFVEAFLVERYSRQNELMACEPFIDGKYVKYSNNYGFVSSDDRNTPQAFSHFSHWHSNGLFIVIDVQGVGDKYTDPQVHSKAGRGWGKGNLGREGMDKFFSTHRCNSICKMLGLTDKVTDFKGTVPRLAIPYEVSYDRKPTVKELQFFDVTQTVFDHIVECFKVADVDGSGEICIQELPNLCRALERDVTTDELVTILERYDEDESGALSLLEFLMWWTGHEFAPAAMSP